MKYIGLFFSTILFSSVNSYSLPQIYKKNVDQKIFNVMKPATINYIMVPFVGIVDTFWISKKGTITDIAAIGAADQIFFIFFSSLNFLPIILTPKISQLYNQKKSQEISNILNISIFTTCLLSILSFTLIFNIEFIASLFMEKGSTVYIQSIEYLKCRTLGMPFSLYNCLIFSFMRGMFDYKSAIKMNGITQIINLVLDPIMIDMIGMKGAAISTLFSECVCSIGFTYMLIKKQIFSKQFRNMFSILKDFIKQGSSVQIRIIMLQLLYIHMNKNILKMDINGINMATQIIIMKFMNIANILYRSLSITSSTIIPKSIMKNEDKTIQKRLLYWTNIIGFVQGVVFLNFGKYVHILTNDVNVIHLLKTLSKYVCFYQYLDGLHSVVEGILQGYQSFILPSTISFLLYIPMFYFIQTSNNLVHLWTYINSFMILKNVMYYIILTKNNKMVKKIKCR